MYFDWLAAFALVSFGRMRPLLSLLGVLVHFDWLAALALVPFEWFAALLKFSSTFRLACCACSSLFPAPFDWFAALVLARFERFAAPGHIL